MRGGKRTDAVDIPGDRHRLERPSRQRELVAGTERNLWSLIRQVVQAEHPHEQRLRSFFKLIQLLLHVSQTIFSFLLNTPPR
jgi:hypothetical protein